jgi:endonuclease YncB( thermonuclease family)
MNRRVGLSVARIVRHLHCRRASTLSLLVTLLVMAGGRPVAHAECRMQAMPRAAVAEVIDGGTLRLGDGREVRLAGIVAPLGFDAGISDAQWPPARAARDHLRAIAEGKTVALGGIGSGRTDRLGRIVAQVFVLDGDRELWLQGEMLESGNARVTQQKDQRGCADELLAFEAVARTAGRGVWSNGAYAVRPAARSRDLVSLAGSYVVLTGRISWVAEGRQAIAFGFDSRWTAQHRPTRGVTVFIANNDREMIGTFGGDAQKLRGQNAEVRGWLELRADRQQTAVSIDLTTAGMLILLSDQPSTPAARVEPAE